MGAINTNHAWVSEEAGRAETCCDCRFHSDGRVADIKAFLNKLPKDRVSDLPIRVADVGGYKVGVYGVFRPKVSV